ncbi:hypothetical protein GCM10009827_016030 [Dactylosporangium maewongense]|uniref:Uncharacterized protein n=1 Tax=Dactylosporangium maewongense TaxID=634393 RepID=A0ABN1ZSY9_9ACTN
MTRAATVAHQFVDVVPDTLQQGIVYVCIPYTTAVHLCLCGCGGEVATPIKPTGWRLGFNGVAISLDPSIGNWSFTCRSHYWITDGRVRWDRQWGPAEVAFARAREDAHRERHFDDSAPKPVGADTTASLVGQPASPARRVSAWLRPDSWLRRWRKRRGARPDRKSR